jgi:hypothetical protein
MKKCVYTSLVNNYDAVREQKMCPGWDYICICDDSFRSDTWKCVEFDKGTMSNSLASRYPKLVPHKFLEEYDYSVYIDASVTIVGDVQLLCEELDWPKFCTGVHPDRNSLFQEIDICTAIGKGNAKDLKTQKDFYKSEKMDPSIGLFENGILFRDHNNENTIKLGEYWWDQLMLFSHRDQVSLPFVLWKYDLLDSTSCFPEGFKKKNFKIPIAHGGIPPFKVPNQEKDLFFKLKELISSKTQIVCHRSPCLLSDYLNCDAIASVNYMNKPPMFYDTIVLYNMISAGHSIGDVLDIIQKSSSESSKILLIEDDVKSRKSKVINSLQFLSFENDMYQSIELYDCLESQLLCEVVFN